MPKNNENDHNNKGGVSLGGALFPMSLGMLAGVLFVGSPAPDLTKMQVRLQDQISGVRDAYVQDRATYSRGASYVGTVTDVKGDQTPDVVYKPNQWVINKSTSTLSFEALQYGQKFSGSFAFDGEIIFDPQNLDKAFASIEVDISSIATGSLTRDEQARSRDWFDVGVYPRATFTSVAFTKSGEGEDYIAHGVLNLRGVDVPIDLPFSLRFYEESAGNKEIELAKTKVEMVSQISLSRFELGVGQGEWEDEEVISDKVDIFIVLQASKP